MGLASMVIDWLGFVRGTGERYGVHGISYVYIYIHIYISGLR